jgi:uncharacterized protein YndB with AHSA1/START domain
VRSISTASRTATIAAPQAELWELISDAHHHPRWWPGVERVEGVTEGRFTHVLKTKRGRPVRVDFVIAESRPPWVSAWRQELAGTPFARVLSESVIQLNLEPEGEATTVTIAHQQKLRGYSRTGVLMLRRSTDDRLEEALQGLARLIG